MSEQMIDFDKLEDIRQANVRKAKYHLKRNGDDTFIISEEGKMVIGYDATQGVNVKAGGGIVVIACLPKEDNRCTSGLLNGAVGNKFTSNLLEAQIQKQGIVAEKYEFASPEEYNGLKYFKIVPMAQDEEDEGSDPAEQMAAEAQAEEQASVEANPSADNEEVVEESVKQEEEF